MKKPRIAICSLALAMALWAARPVALADEIEWITPGEEIHEAGGTLPEPEEESPAASEFYGLEFGETGGEDNSDWLFGSDEDSGGSWLIPDLESPVNEDTDTEPEEDEEGNWLSAGEDEGVQEVDPVPEKEKWLTPDSSPVVEEEAAPDEMEWLMPDESPVEITEKPEIEEETWLTLDAPPEAEETEQEEPEQKRTEEPEQEKTEQNKETVEEEKTAKSTRDKEAVLEVTIPSSGEVIINPHRHPVKIGDTEVREQIINSAQRLINRSGVPIIVTASVTVNTENSGGLTVTDHPIEEEETDKLAYLYVEFSNQPNGNEEPAWIGSYTGAPNQLLASENGVVTGDVLRVEAGDEIPVYASYRLFGSLSENPAVGWQNGDKLSVTVSFSFRPAEDEEQETTTEPEAAEKPEMAEGHETAKEPEMAEGHETAKEPETAEEPKRIEEPAETEVFLEEKAEAKPEEAPEVTPEPEPNPEPDAQKLPASEPELPQQMEQLEVEKEVESFADRANPDWLIPPEENSKEG